MIDIFGTIINESEVIGVGPLMVKVPADPSIRQLYNERAFYFEVYTIHYHFVITTDWLSFTADCKEASAKVHGSISRAHKEVKTCLINGSFARMEVHSVKD